MATVLVVESTVAARFERVWRALRDPREIRRWHGWDYDGLDAEIDAIYVSGAEADEAEGTIGLRGVQTRFALERRGETTVVRVTKAGPAGDAYDEIDEGWISFFEQLRFALERHPAEDRRTLHFEGGADPLTPATLGLHPAEAAPVGERWSGTSRWGESLAGDVHHRGANQVGLSVESWNDALLVLQARRAIVSTYGLDDATFEALRERLASWWKGNVRPALP